MYFFFFVHLTSIMKYINAHIIHSQNSLKKFWMLIIFISINFLCRAQQFNNWIFHNNNGLNFNTTPPSFLAGGQITNISGYSTSTISDRNGNLLFYSDGEKVWNRNNQLMPNGFGLLGKDGQINTALIVPFVNDTSKYYLFISKGLTFHTPNVNDEINYYFSYNIVDMNLNGGLGDIVIKNILIKNFANEKMVAIPHSNGIDIWWVCRDWTTNFYSYKINCQGFQINTPVISTIGLNINYDDNKLASGDIKTSSDGNFIAACYKDYLEIYKFNNSTGVFSNSINIPTTNCYGIEFSADSKLLYITQRFPTNTGGEEGSICQYNLANYNTTAVLNSRIRIEQGNFLGDGGLQIGPDKKIYFTDGGFGIDRIKDPNVQGIGCNFQADYITLPNEAFLRFPYAAPLTFINQNTQITYTVGPDCRTVTLRGKTFIKGNNLTFKWSFGTHLPLAPQQIALRR